MHSDPSMHILVFSIFFIIVIGFIMKSLKQPSVVGYLLAGLALGPFGLSILPDTEAVSRLGGLGVVLLMFFVGIEMCLPCLVAKWRIVIFGTLFQIIASVAVVGFIGIFFNWSFNRILFLGFVISLSSTAVVIKLLKDSNELDTDVGQSVIGVLLAQDLAVIPMILILQLLGKPELHIMSFAKQAFGFSLFLLSIIWVSKKKTKMEISFGRLFFSDPEFQVFIALLLCFGSAALFGLLELSTALGAFAAGIAVAALKNTEWVHHHLSPFRVVFISLFFVSVGMQLDITFLRENWLEVLSLVVGVLSINTFINGLIFKIMGMTWHQSLYAGSLLSQIGEFSFVLAAIGYNAGFISAYGFNLAMSTIVVSLMMTVVWVKPMARWALKHQKNVNVNFPLIK
ncbi:MAG: cation:proton antiporter [Proteobacteria bacterium]|nr:cation:proton antiporter [Pseudomonadota bacterium]